MAAEQAMRWLKTVLGLLSGLAIIGLVASLSFLFWYERGAAVSAPLGLAYGVIAAALELVKALAPFWIYAHARARDIVATLMACLLLAVAVAVSFSSAAGVAAQLRLGQSARFERMQESIATDRAEIARLEVRRAGIGVVRSVSELEAAIASALAAPIRVSNRVLTLGAASSGCKELSRQIAPACNAIAALRAELGQAKEIERIDARIRELRDHSEEMMALGSRNGAAADHQAQLFAAAVAMTVGWMVSEFGVQAGLILLMAIACELAAGWVLYLTLSYHALAGQRLAASKAETGDVVRFCAECLMPGTGRLTLADLHVAYRDWCWRRGLRPLSRRVFRRDLERVARRNDITRSGGEYEGVSIDAATAERELAGSGLAKGSAKPEARETDGDLAAMA